MIIAYKNKFRQGEKNTRRKARSKKHARTRPLTTTKNVLDKIPYQAL